jgi:hypothetical protein
VNTYPCGLVEGLGGDCDEAEDGEGAEVRGQWGGPELTGSHDGDGEAGGVQNRQGGEGVV